MDDDLTMSDSDLELLNQTLGEQRNAIRERQLAINAELSRRQRERRAAAPPAPGATALLGTIPSSATVLGQPAE